MLNLLSQAKPEAQKLLVENFELFEHFSLLQVNKTKNLQLKSNVSRFARKSSLIKTTLVSHLTRGRRSKKIIKPLAPLQVADWPRPLWASHFARERSLTKTLTRFASFEVVDLPRALRSLDSLEAVGEIGAFTPIASLSILD